jgi:dTDP-glucose 4,6-dehydratase
MKLFVTGGAGFIGSNFIRYWLTHHPEDNLINYDLLTYAGNLENLADLAGNPHYRFIKGDICDRDLVNASIQGADLIVHFAAESHVDRSILEPDTFVRTNVLGTQVLLEAARKSNLRFHHISTDEVFGSLQLDSDAKFTETTPYDPSSPYSASKAGSDHLVRAYHRTYNLPVTISNTSNNFGPFHFPEKFIPLAITNLILGKKIPLYGQGNQMRDWLYVEDHCRAIDLIINQGKIGETYLIGGTAQNLTNLDVAKMIIKIMGKSEAELEFITDRPGHDVRYAIDWSKAQRDLGYQPQFSFEEYLHKTIDWYQTHQDWWQRIRSGEYQEYYRKQYNT